MTHEDLRDHYELYALGLLEAGPEKDEIESHLASGCPDCQAHLKEALVIQSLMLSQVPDVVPPARLKGRVMAVVGAPGFGWAWLATGAAAAMLIVTLWLGIESGLRQDELDTTRATLAETQADRDRLQQVFLMLAQPETKQVTFGQPETTPPKGNVYLHPRLGVTLIASNLPLLPESQVYEMWIVPKQGAPRPAGLFRSDLMGEALHVLAGPLDLAQVNAIAVTVEPAAGSPAPTSDIIIVAAPQA